ncbi:hypothetical protein LIP24_10215 [Collinsella aerofaciens]|nr:hypothetical protein [Collinsella aerofaciens]MCB5369051.1 hypothetical protein [Collinsella aerofaciens]
MWWATEEETPRYERQLENVNHLVLDTINKKGVYLNMKQLETILKCLYEWRIID